MRIPTLQHPLLHFFLCLLGVLTLPQPVEAGATFSQPDPRPPPLIHLPTFATPETHGLGTAGNALTEMPGNPLRNIAAFLDPQSFIHLTLCSSHFPQQLTLTPDDIIYRRRHWLGPAFGRATVDLPTISQAKLPRT